MSPAGKDRATNNQKSYAQSLIDVFTQAFKADLIALCEVNEDDISDIREKCHLKGYRLFNGFTKAGKTHFDTCVLYKSDSLHLHNTSNITAKKGGRTYKVAQRLEFAIPEHRIPLHVLLSHWPSRLFMQQNHPDRAYLGMKLRAVVDELIEVYKDKAAVVLLGDYNDEPFDHSLSEHLMATRDRELVKNKKQLLYNPFWRQLGHHNPYTHDSDSRHSDCGTYFYKSDTVTRWRTFDQIIFSSGFLGATKWHLNEKYTQIVSIPAYREFVLDHKTVFDHFPVMGVIEEAA